MKKYNCIIFDCDGVLVDSESIAGATIIEMAKELGTNIDFNYVQRNFTGASLQNILNNLQSIIDRPLPANFESEYRRRSFESFANNLKPINGIETILKSLKIPFCVASSGPQNKITHNLKLTGLYPYFEGNIFSCYDIQKWKPKPDIFLHAAKSMGFEIDECIVIEDTSIGIQAARSGGFDVFGYADDYSFTSHQKEATKVFKDMDELKLLLDVYLF